MFCWFWSSFFSIQLLTLFSIYQIASLACCEESEYGMRPSSTIICALKMLGSENHIVHRQDESVTEDGEFDEHCQSIKDSNANYPDLPLPEEISASFIPNTTSSSISSAHVCSEVNFVHVIL